MRPFLLALAILLAALPAEAQYEVTLVANLTPPGELSFPYNLVVYDGRIFFSMGTSDSRSELWSYDAETGEAVLVADINTGLPSPTPIYLTPYAGKLYFAAGTPETGTELWSYDASTDGTNLVADIWPGNGYSFPQQLFVFDDRLFFSANDGSGRKLWIYDSVTDDVEMVASLTISNAAAHFAAYSDRLFFQARESLLDDYELWAFDPTIDHASLITDISGSHLPYPNYLTVCANLLFFSADSNDSNSAVDPELWSYNALTGEAGLVADIYPGPLASYPRHLRCYGDQLFFASDDGVSGRELWAFDTSTGSFDLMADIYPGDEGASPEYLLVYDSKLFFQAEDSTNGEELWAFDQDSGLASLVADIQVGSEGSHPFSLILYDDTLYFVAVGEDQVGFALWSLTPAPVANEPSAVPQPAHLHAPHPNPARSGATVSFDIAEAGPVRVEVLDVLGRRVALLADGPVAAGEHALRWEAGALPSGLYLVRLTAGDTVQTQRLTLVR